MIADRMMHRKQAMDSRCTQFLLHPKGTSINPLLFTTRALGEVHMDLHSIANRSPVRLENGNNVIHGLLRLLLNAVADQPAIDRVDRTMPLTKMKSPARHLLVSSWLLLSSHPSDSCRDTRKLSHSNSRFVANRKLSTTAVPARKRGQPGF